MSGSKFSIGDRVKLTKESYTYYNNGIRITCDSNTWGYDLDDVGYIRDVGFDHISWSGGEIENRYILHVEFVTPPNPDVAPDPKRWNNKKDCLGERGIYLHEAQLELATQEEEDAMTMNFRNGDVIEVRVKQSNRLDDFKQVVFVKFGEYYYNLTDGGQMKGYKSLPKGKREILTNLSGLGEYFTMEPEDLEKRLMDNADSVEEKNEVPF